MKILTSTSSVDQIGNFGNKEYNRLFNEMGIRHIKISNSLLHFDRINQIYDLHDYTNTNSKMPCLFFGVYSQVDIDAIKQCKGIKYVMFGGSDIDDNISVSSVTHTLQQLHHLDNIYFLSISQDIEQRLNKYNIDSKLIKLNLVDYTIFNSVKRYGKCIYIYNGLNKNESDDVIYGKEYYDKVCEFLPQYDYIFSSDLGLSYNDMPSVYKKCFIALRLTGHDGNANTVQELEVMKIPVIHNHSDYGLKWKTINNVIKHINSVFNELFGNDETYTIQETSNEIEIQIIDDQSILSISSVEQSEEEIDFSFNVSTESYLLNSDSDSTVSGVESTS